MNYRILFFISILILIIGLGGLIMMPSQQTTSEINSEPVQTEPEKKAIKVAVAVNSLPAGTILKDGDYQVSEMQVEADSSLISEDVSEALTRNNNSLNGLLISEATINGRFLPPQNLISPTDERFLFYTVGKGEVIYRVYIRNEHQFALDTLKSGDIVGLFALQKDFGADNSEQMRFDPVLQNLEVVKIDRFNKNANADGEDNNNNNASTEELKDYAGYVSIRMDANKVKEVLSLTRSRSLLVLPQSEDVIRKSINQRGLTIRSLRGKTN